MGRRPKTAVVDKPVEEVTGEVVAVLEKPVEVVEPVEFVRPVEVVKPLAKAPASDEASRIAESREALKHPLPFGNKFFESPEGYIVIAESDRADVWCRYANKGKGMKIQPMR
jgi:hypothetical protein